MLHAVLSFVPNYPLLPPPNGVDYGCGNDVKVHFYIVEFHPSDKLGQNSVLLENWAICRMAWHGRLFEYRDGNDDQQVVWQAGELETPHMALPTPHMQPCQSFFPTPSGELKVTSTRKLRLGPSQWKSTNIPL